MLPLCGNEYLIVANEIRANLLPLVAANNNSCRKMGGSLEDSSTTPPPSLTITEVPIAKKTKPSISFCPEVTVHSGAVLHIDEYSEAEITGSWYRADEMREIRRQVKEIVALMNQNALVGYISKENGGDETKTDENGTEIDRTVFGLEGKTKAGKQYRKETRLASLCAVFDTQTLQQLESVSDPAMIAQNYVEYAYPMQIAALERAARNQQEVATIYGDETNNPLEQDCNIIL